MASKEATILTQLQTMKRQPLDHAAGLLQGIKENPLLATHKGNLSLGLILNTTEDDGNVFQVIEMMTEQGGLTEAIITEAKSTLLSRMTWELAGLNIAQSAPLRHFRMQMAKTVELLEQANWADPEAYNIAHATWTEMVQAPLIALTRENPSIEQARGQYIRWVLGGTISEEE